MGRAAHAIAAALTTLSLAGCSLLFPVRESPPTAAPQPSGRPGATVTVTVSATPGQTPSASDDPPSGRVISVEQGAFMSPSGRIACMIAADTEDGPQGVRCDYQGTPDWKLPKPARCEYDWGRSVTLIGRALVTCAGDTVMGMAEITADNEYAAWHQDGDPVVSWQGKKLAALGYGDTIAAGSYTCTMREVGLTCTNVITDASFFMSKQRVALS